MEELQSKKLLEIQFDEMETFEHSKCKPLSLPIMVEKKTRKILAMDTAKMPAKGHLARIARKKYGYRKDERGVKIFNVLKTVAPFTSNATVVMSDENPRYPRVVQKVLGPCTHETTKGRRGCVVGQGELKEGGFDPLFSLNHSYAMYRDNLKRLARRTWCTTKDPKRLLDLLYMYGVYHNQHVEGCKSPKLLTVRSTEN